MQSVLDEFQKLVSTYTESDYLQKCREAFKQKASQLDESEISAFLEFLVRRGGDAVFIAFCEEAHPLLELEQAKVYSQLLCERVKNLVFFQVYQIRLGYYFLKLPDYIVSKDSKSFYQFALELAIKYDCICALQKLLLKDKEIGFIERDLDGFEGLIQNQPDRRVGENIRNYLLNGTIAEDWQNAVNGNNEYVPDVYVDYFATQGLEICKENLKSYKKPRLLSAKTTLEELNDFIDNQYNWDDGVEIPYFIMYHKNCDLALRKKLFELGAGDCIDENTYKDVDKDPWKRFILELDEMIKKEENK